ncbi:MAG: NDP-mannose synthase [Thermoleophilaceae bacterium]|jgi:NDP-sugar pyrophosphorylase family protein|nr:NDP-mannose synthase [Thermoleophilaceae bacterium]
MKAIIFAGGKGARLLPYTHVLPKPLLPVGEQSILEIILAQLRHSGITDISMATGYKSTLIEGVIGDGAAYGVDITYYREKEPLGTVGALAEVPAFEDTFIMMNGDVLTDEPLYGNLLQAHRSSGAALTVACKLEEIEIDYGVLHLGDDLGGARRIERIEEKPRYSWPVSMGVYAVEPHVQAMVERGHKTDFPDLITHLLANGHTVAAYEHPGYWLDIGRLHHLEEAVQDFESSAGRFLTDTDSFPRLDTPPPS